MQILISGEEFERPDGEIGRRSGLKIRRPQGRGGSSPPPGTNKINQFEIGGGAKTGGDSGCLIWRRPQSHCCANSVVRRKTKCQLTPIHKHKPRHACGLVQFQTILKASCFGRSDYDKAHAAVWQEMLDLFKRAGNSEYSIFVVRSCCSSRRESSSRNGKRAVPQWRVLRQKSTSAY